MTMDNNNALRLADEIAALTVKRDNERAVRAHVMSMRGYAENPCSCWACVEDRQLRNDVEQTRHYDMDNK